MELTYNWAALGTSAGCTAAVVLVTQYLKGFLPKWLPTRIFVLLLANLILIGVWWFGGTAHDGADIPLIVINAFVVALAAMGAYETSLKVTETTTAETTTTETTEETKEETVTEAAADEPAAEATTTT